MEDYEVNFSQKIINPHFIIIIIISIGLFYFFAYPIMQTHTEKNVDIPPVKNISTVVEYVTVLVTPTPDGKTYFASEFQSGIRKIQNPFSFYRKNVTGLKDIKVTSFVYDYRIYNVLHWFNPSDYKYYEMSADSDKKFLFVFYAMYMDDIAGDDTRFYIPNKRNYVVQSLKNNKLYYPIEYPNQLRIEELEYAYDYTNTNKAQYFGQIRKYTRDLSASNTAGEISIEQNWLRGGLSNMQSGYILYEIPSEIKDEDLLAGINFYGYGNAWWKLKNDNKIL